MLEVVEEAEREETVHGGHRASVRWQLLRLPAVDDAPPLAVQRTVIAGLEPEQTRGTVVLVHGLAQNHRSFQISRRSLPAWLAERGYEVLNLDLRGHGLSRRFGSPPARGVDDYVGDLARLVRALPREPFVAGHSLGAAVALRTAPKVELAGLIHWAGIYTFARENRVLRGAARVGLTVQGFIPDHLGFDFRRVGKLIGDLHPIAEPLNARAPIQGWGYRSFEKPMLRERLLEGFDVTGLAVLEDMSRWALGARIDDGSFAALEELPLLVISGEADRLATIADGRACYEASRSRDRTHLIISEANEGYAAGHLDIVIGARAPDIVWPKLQRWLDDRSSS